MIIKGIAIFYLNLRILRIEQADSRLRRACPPPDTGRGWGPQDTSSAQRDEVDCGRGRSERSERSLSEVCCLPD